MSSTSSRNFHKVAIEPSASALLQAVSQATSSTDTGRNDNVRHEEAANRQHLPNYFAFNFNFKPDSTHDCKKGALFQPSLSQSHTADWQLELESHEEEIDASSSNTADTSEAARKKPAHVFTGPQSASKVYDLILVWDAAARVYRLDRIAATFSLKYERSKTTLSNQSQEVWTSDAVRPGKRAAHDSSAYRTAISSMAVNPSQGPQSSGLAAKRGSSSLLEVNKGPSDTPTVSSSTGLGRLKLRGRASDVAPSTWRSSRKSLAVDMEEFDDQTETSAEPPSSATPIRSRRNSTLQASEQRIKAESKRFKADGTSHTHPGLALRRSRRRSSPTQAEGTASPPQRPPTDAAEAAAAERKGEHVSMEQEDDDLALALERELEREMEVEGDSENDEQGSPAQLQPPPRTYRTLSPVSRFKHSEKQTKISTPNAHTPESDDVATARPSPSLRHLKRCSSPLTHEPALHSTASIGLGLQQTGVGITPTTSPHLGTASPQPGSPPNEESGADLSKTTDGVKEAVRNEDEEDDDLENFAAELDMSLAEVPDTSPVAPLPVVAERRRSTRVLTSAQNVTESRGGSSAPRQVRKAYGLGGPRQEEEELEDSD